MREESLDGQRQRLSPKGEKSLRLAEGYVQTGGGLLYKHLGIYAYTDIYKKVMSEESFDRQRQRLSPKGMMENSLRSADGYAQTGGGL